MPEYRGDKSIFGMKEDSTTELSGILNEELILCSFSPPLEYAPLPEFKEPLPDKQKTIANDVASEDQINALKGDEALVEKCQNQANTPVTAKKSGGFDPSKYNYPEGATMTCRPPGNSIFS